MKNFILFKIILLLLLPIQIFSQTKIELKLRLENILPEKFISQSIADKQIKRPSKSDIFMDKDSRTIINKTILDNGFFLSEKTLAKLG